LFAAPSSCGRTSWRVSILAPSGEEEQPEGERRYPLELLLIIVILLVLFGGFGFSRR